MKLLHQLLLAFATRAAIVVSAQKFDYASGGYHRTITDTSPAGLTCSCNTKEVSYVTTTTNVCTYSQRHQLIHAVTDSNQVGKPSPCN